MDPLPRSVGDVLRDRANHYLAEARKPVGDSPATTVARELNRAFARELLDLADDLDRAASQTAEGKDQADDA